MARDLWTDERLDDLNVRVDRGFEGVDLRFEGVQREFVAIRTEMRAEFAAVREEMRIEFTAARAEMRTEFAAVRTEIGTVRTELSGQMAATQRLMLQLFIPQTVAMALGFAGLILTRV